MNQYFVVPLLILFGVSILVAITQTVTTVSKDRMRVKMKELSLKERELLIKERELDIKRD